MKDRFPKVTFNGIGGFESHITAADAVEGWIEVLDSYRRYPGGGKRIPITNGSRVIDVIKRRLYGDVKITFRGIEIPRAGSPDWGRK